MPQNSALKLQYIIIQSVNQCGCWHEERTFRRSGTHYFFLVAAASAISFKFVVVRCFCDALFAASADAWCFASASVRPTDCRRCCRCWTSWIGRARRRRRCSWTSMGPTSPPWPRTSRPLWAPTSGTSTSSFAVVAKVRFSTCPLLCRVQQCMSNRFQPPHTEYMVDPHKHVHCSVAHATLIQS